ncbi:MAG TPA: hypothetical protein VMU36_14560 [Spirochaetia bacterium]|nr:hypothetical protein [Spirochaetia bacterium]
MPPSVNSGYYLPQGGTDDEKARDPVEGRLDRVPRQIIRQLIDALQAALRE